MHLCVAVHTNACNIYARLHACVHVSLQRRALLHNQGCHSSQFTFHAYIQMHTNARTHIHTQTHKYKDRERERDRDRERGWGEERDAHTKTHTHVLFFSLSLSLTHTHIHEYHWGISTTHQSTPILSATTIFTCEGACSHSTCKLSENMLLGTFSDEILGTLIDTVWYA